MAKKTSFKAQWELMTVSQRMDLMRFYPGIGATNIDSIAKAKWSRLLNCHRFMIWNLLG